MKTLSISRLILPDDAAHIPCWQIFPEINRCLAPYYDMTISFQTRGGNV
jgi:hypothetical protein